MPRVGEFCASNIVRLLLGVFIVVTLILALGVWTFYSPGKGKIVDYPKTTATPAKP